MEKEIWKDIQGFEGLYQVSNTGKVKSLERVKLGKCGCLQKVKEKILKQGKNKGYFYVILCKDNVTKAFRVNRLVADSFIPNPENKTEVGHKDDDKSNNSVENLYWTDHKTNCNDGSRNKRISESMIGVFINRKDLSKRVMCVETGKVYESTKEVERLTGVAHQNISSCCNGKYKTTCGYHWKYVD